MKVCSMASLNPPVCDFGWQAPDFNLVNVDGNLVSRDLVMGKNGLLVMFICNHCPYVKAILPRLIYDAGELKMLGVNTVAVTAKLVTFKGCDPGVDGQKLKNRSELALGAASSVSWIELMLVRAGAPDKVARCAALAGVSAVSFDTLNDEAGFEPLAKAVKAATPACEKG